jgi:small subunit ribosomal protein S1
MSTELQPHQTPSMSSPPPPDEGYWAALLREGETAKGEAQSASDSEVWDDLISTTDHLSSPNGSNQAAALQCDWTIAETTYRSDEVVTLDVISHNRGGLLVAWNSLRGFVPASQLVDFPVGTDEAARRRALSQQVGRSLPLRIIELDAATNRLILSERAAQVEAGQRMSVLHNLSPGDVREGVVTNLCDFGVFVDLGGVEGLIHISELSWGRVSHPCDTLTRGQTVRAFVMSVDPENERVALSLKRLQPDPWESVEERYHVGQIVEGVITNVVDFGAFARIEEGLEGLIHVSELAEGQFLHPRNVVKEGDEVRVCVLHIDGPARRLGLSLRSVDGYKQPD